MVETSDILKAVLGAGAGSGSDEKRDKLPKPWCATVYDGRGNVVQDAKGKDIIAGFDLASAADRFADRRLFECASDCFAVIASTRMFRANGEPISTTVMRNDAIARVLKGKRPSACRKGAPSSILGFVGKAHQTRVEFSRG